MCDQHSSKAEETLTNLRCRVDAAVAENFGYCPTDAWFDSLIDEMREAEECLRKIAPDRYKEYSDKHY